MREHGRVYRAADTAGLAVLLVLLGVIVGCDWIRIQMRRLRSWRPAVVPPWDRWAWLLVLLSAALLSFACVTNPTPKPPIPPTPSGPSCGELGGPNAKCTPAGAPCAAGLESKGATYDCPICCAPAATPTPTPEPTPVPTPTPPPSTGKIERRADGTLWTVPYFPGAGSRWEAWSKIPWFWKKFYPVENVVRFGGWDCEPTSDTSQNDLIGCQNTFAEAIAADKPGVKWIFAPDYKPTGVYLLRGLQAGANVERGATYEQREPGDDRPPRLIALPRLSIQGLTLGAGTIVTEDPFMRRQIAEWGRDPQRWQDTLWIEFGDEWGISLDEARLAVAWLRGVIAELGYSPKPITMTYSQGQWPGSCAAFDACSWEAYSDPPGERTRDAILGELRQRFDAAVSTLPAGVDMIVVPQCYTRNGAWTDLPNAQAVCVWGYRAAWEQRGGKVVAAIPFSGARPTGIWDNYDLYWSVVFGAAQYVMGLSDVWPTPMADVPPKGKIASVGLSAPTNKWFGGAYDDTRRAGPGNLGYGYTTYSLVVKDKNGTPLNPNDTNYQARSAKVCLVRSDTGQTECLIPDASLPAPSVRWEGNAPGAHIEPNQYYGSGGSSFTVAIDDGTAPGTAYTTTVEMGGFSSAGAGFVVDDQPPWPAWLMVPCQNHDCKKAPYAACVEHGDRLAPCRGAMARCTFCKSHGVLVNMGSVVNRPANHLPY
jgi:hypothetical protein